MNELFAMPRCVRRQIPQNSNLWQPDDVAETLYFLERGRVCIFNLDREGRESMLETISSGEFFGEHSLCQNGDAKRTSTARALTDCAILEFTAQEFIDCLRRDRAFLESFISSLLNRMSQAERRISILATRGVEQRLAFALLHLASARKTPQTDGNTQINLTHDELSAFASISRQRVTKTLNYFREIGLVRYDRTLPLAVNRSALFEYLQL